MRITLMVILVMFVSACGGGNNTVEEAAKPTPKSTPVQTANLTLAQQRELESLIEKARLANAGNDNTRAEELLLKALDMDPTSEPAHGVMGKVMRALGRYSEAFEHHTIAAKFASDPKDRSFLLERAAEDAVSLAREAIEIKEWKMAEEFLNDALKLVPADTDILLLKANAQYEQKRYEDALETYSLAADISLGDSRRYAIYWQGQCEYALGRYSEAEKKFTTVIQEAYTADDVYGWRAYCRYAQEKLSLAAEDFALAQQYATTAEKKQEFADAEMKLRKALDGDD